MIGRFSNRVWKEPSLPVLTEQLYQVQLQLQLYHCVEQLFHERALDMRYYYIDKSVLLENTPRVKFITTSGIRVAYFPYPHW